MSYCRFSTNGFRCDLYVYADAEGFTVHVAASRIPEDAPELPDIQTLAAAADWSGYLQAQRALSDYLLGCERTPIGGPHDGATFHLPNLDALHARLRALRDDGYRFPDSVLEAVAAERRAEGEDTDDACKDPPA
jgi:hypothetical protein